MFCKKCGNQLTEADKFCQKCGEKVESNGQNIQENVNPFNNEIKNENEQTSIEGFLNAEKVSEPIETLNENIETLNENIETVSENVETINEPVVQNNSTQPNSYINESQIVNDTVVNKKRKE